MNEPTQSIEQIRSRYGEFHVLAAEDLISDSLRQYGEWAQCEIDLLRSFISPGDTVVDAGAYIGTHSRAFSEQVGESGEVFAFEPDPYSYAILLRNSHCAPLKNIRAVNLGLGSTSEFRTLHIEEQQHNRASASAEGTQVADDIRIQIQPLDMIGISKVDFMKVDVEGMELQLLIGAETTILRDRPVIFLEAITLQGSHGFLLWAEGHGYAAFGINVPAFNPHNHAGQTTNMFGSAREVALLLIHRSDLARFSANLARHRLPLIDSMDALALLLLHKPQYLTEALVMAEIYREQGLALETQEMMQIEQLQALLQSKEEALADAANAYAALREAFEQKENELEAHLRELNALIAAKDNALGEAAAAYEALHDALHAKNE